MSLLFPMRCFGCRQSGTWLCDPCRRRIPRWTNARCPRCGASVGGGLLCQRCARVTSLSGSVAAVPYANPVVRTLVHDFKYQPAHRLGSTIAPLLIEAVEDALQAGLWPKAFDFCLPIPLYPKRLRERGFNQAEVLARAVGEHFGWPVRADIVVRQKSGLPQAKLSNELRTTNITGVFGVIDQAAVAGKRILLIDDVQTTTATLSEAAKMLAKAGAAEVWAATVAAG